MGEHFFDVDYVEDDDDDDDENFYYSFILEDKLIYFIPKKYGINHLVKFFSYKMIFHTYFLIFFHKKI